MFGTAKVALVSGVGPGMGRSIALGLARGGVEHAWLAFFPWLTIAAVAPNRQAGPDGYSD